MSTEAPWSLVSQLQVSQVFVDILSEVCSHVDILSFDLGGGFSRKILAWMRIGIGRGAYMRWIRSLGIHHDVSVLNHRSVVKGLLQLNRRGHVEWHFLRSSYVWFHLSVRDQVCVLIIVLRAQVAVSVVDRVRLSDSSSVSVVLGWLSRGMHTRGYDALGVLHCSFSWANHWCLVLVLEGSRARRSLKSANLFCLQVSGRIFHGSSLAFACNLDGLSVPIGIEMLSIEVHRTSIGAWENFLACSSGESCLLECWSMPKLWMVVLITNAYVIWLKMILVLSLHVIKEDILILVCSWEMRSVVHLIKRYLLQSSIVQFISLSFFSESLC